jgi:hypothetical protein
MGEGYPARWLGEQLVARLDPVLARQGFQSGEALVWDGSPQETLATATWKRDNDELTVRYEFWGGRLVLCLKSIGIERWRVEDVVHFNEAVVSVESIIGRELGM